MPTDQEILTANLTADPHGNPSPTACQSVFVTSTYDILAEDIANCLKNRGLYRQDTSYCTIEPADTSTGFQFIPMTNVRLGTWLSFAGICTFLSPPRGKDEQPRPTNLTKTLADYVLASDILRLTTPIIKEVSPLRLPIITHKNGRATLHPAPIGYDPATKIYTIDSIPINWDKHTAKPLDWCRKVLCRVFQDFPLDGGDLHPIQSRSMGAIVTAMLGQFLHHSIPLFPLIIANANQPGTGKTFLVQTMLAPFYGAVAPGNYTEDDNEMRKTLNSALFNGAPFFFLDDLSIIAGRVLPRFVTAAYIKDRELGKNIMFEKPQRMQFFLTGNNLKTSTDIERRTLPIDLFYDGDAATRTNFTTLKEEHLTDPKWRTAMLEALWGLCCHWERQGSPSLTNIPALTSFKPYVATAASIAVAAGFTSPFNPRPVNLDTGDTKKAALIRLIILIADTILPPADTPHLPHTGLTESYTVAQIVDIAKANHLLDIIVGSTRDTNISLGYQIRNLNGRRFTDTRGRSFLVGDKRRAASTLYPFHILSEPTITTEQDTTTPFD